MLPNHSPLVIAEQFGTLASLYPGRIDLGLGRAPGHRHADLRAHAARPRERGAVSAGRGRAAGLLLGRAKNGERCRAVPGAGLEVPLWILGSSLFGARLAAALGLPYAFASHFAPAALMQAIDIYRSEFQPSKQLDRPYVAAGINVVAAETDEEAGRLFTSIQQQFTRLVRGTPGQLPPPVDTMAGVWTPMEKMQASSMLKYSFVGSRETVRSGTDEFLERTQAG